MSQLAIIYNLLLAFDCKEGVSAPIYEATGDLIKNTLGYRAMAVFDKYIDATEDKFYFKNTDAFITCWQELKETAMENFS